MASGFENNSCIGTCKWFYVIPTPWNVKESLSYFTPIENKFLSQFREPSLATTGNRLHLLATEDLLLTPQLVGAVTGRFAQKSISLWKFAWNQVNSPNVCLSFFKPDEKE